MRMPGMDGAHFLEQARLKWPDAIRILLTGYADIESTIHAINAGQIYRYINKPWNDGEIVLIVKEALERRRLEHENGRLNSVVQRQNEELKALNAGLEEKVAARTQDLARAVKAIQQANGRLKTGFIATVQAFSGLVEMRGKNLAGHARRVADLARALAVELKQDEAVQQDVLFAALLHDIGKIGLPDAILDRPVSALDSDQRTEYVRHPERGEQALLQIEQLRNAAKLIRHHHEYFDGSGYPDNLAGIAIPQGSRILAVANDYDALVTGIQVQTPMKPKEALDFILENRGKRYDPVVVDAFLGVMSRRASHLVDEVPLHPSGLKPGMKLARDLMHRDGYLLLAKDFVLDHSVIEQLMGMEHGDGHILTLYIRK